MSISSRDKDPKAPGSRKDKKKFVRIWRVEASKEFILFMSIMVFAIATSLYNPYEIRKLGEQLVEIASYNKVVNTQSLNNTDKIIENLLITSENATASRADIVKMLLLFDEVHQYEHSKILTLHNLTDERFINFNGTHVETEYGIAELPFPIDLIEFRLNGNGNVTHTQYSETTATDRK